MHDSPLPMLLALAGIAAEFCAQPEMWPMFREFMEEGMEKGVGEVPREAMQAASGIIVTMVQRLENEMLDAEFADLLSTN